MLGISPAHTEAGSQSTLTDQAYRRLRGAILSGALEPDTKLRVEHIKLELGTGASAVREALLRLSGEGLVRMEERRGFFVSPVTLDDLWDLTQMRMDLETKALRMAIHDGDDQWEAGIVAAFHRLSLLDAQLKQAPPRLEWEERHSEYHEALVAACQSKWLMRFRRILFDQSERYRRLSLSQLSVARDVPGEHRSLMEATLSRDVDTACAHLRAHIMRTAEIVAEDTALRCNTAGTDGLDRADPGEIGVPRGAGARKRGNGDSLK
ncbi:MAG: transcriptional regulator [Rhodobacteraceae bacterium HLUCCA08]|nr:MAG: transcriptional regulator [Rhodobacteraceae bacterium HLUCCA08]